MLEVSSSDWAWHGGPWVISISCQAETSSLPLSLLPTAQKHCEFTGKMPKNILEKFWCWTADSAGQRWSFSRAMQMGGSLSDAARTLATLLFFILCH